MEPLLEHNAQQVLKNHFTPFDNGNIDSDVLAGGDNIEQYHESEQSADVIQGEHEVQN